MLIKSNTSTFNMKIVSQKYKHDLIWFTSILKYLDTF